MVCRSTCPSITHLISSCRDTVHSVGLIEKHMPFTGTNNAILYTRHALSLDERRVKFRPFFWNSRDGGGDAAALGHSKEDSEDTLDTTEGEESPVEVRDYEARVNSENGSETNVKEVFFAGAHCGTSRSIHVQQTRDL